MLNTNTLCGLFFVLLWLPEKGLSSSGIGIRLGIGCYAYCTNTTIAPNEEVINFGEGRCFWEGTECEVGACCKCYDVHTGKNTTSTFNNCESFRARFGSDNVKIVFG